MNVRERKITTILYDIGLFICNNLNLPTKLLVTINKLLGTVWEQSILVVKWTTFHFPKYSFPFYSYSTAFPFLIVHIISVTFHHFLFLPAMLVHFPYND